VLAIVLHAHLPFVRHPEHEESVEERWLFEAVLECYLPIVAALRRLAHEGVPARISMSMTPPLVAMLTDELILSRTTRHIDRLVELAAREAREAPEGERGVAAFYRERLAGLRALWDEIGRDLPGAIAALSRAGLVEVLGCAATHAYLPLLVADERSGAAAVRAQLEVGLASHERVFGSRPRGLWLPECGWDPRLDDALAKAGVDHVVLETHGVLHATPRPLDGVHAPIRSPAGIAAFARDPEASWQVWSADHGYPGDPMYRDFYRDAGYERSAEALGALAHPARVPLPTGLKYRRVGDKGPDKPLYDPDAARARTRAHAAHFLERRAEAVRAAAPAMGNRPPLVVAPYDAELFGHWWFEGPDFLEEVLRLSATREETRTTTLAAHLALWPIAQISMPEASSWGEGGYSHVWCNESNAWMWPEVRAVTARLVDAVRTGDARRRRALEQAAREVLLAQSSDWPFLAYTRTAGEYPIERLKTHLLRAEKLLGGDVDEGWLMEMEGRDNLFAGMEVARRFGPDRNVPREADS
jgi:1,4-alpha-glucan branching enzyme